ncbi:SAM-dependent methyltransferase [Lysinibacillus sp. KCTC 33748]|uniref:class I SAM-dependent methyltransferase n=1 Tax=unclassified Lysinibacillus TaxID=2636778 RepID=UPI0009A64CF1|nr:MULTISPECIES: class I SAM-dependent methyltransferase [unclassified Lysinibacillus]OXS77259.1 SAM-dependent methyltransferase [Lysinibacillus sp. KCTC 33748]
MGVIGLNTWDQRFNTIEYVYGEQPNAFIEDYVHYLEDYTNVAAYAEGEGRNAVFLALQGHTVTAFDYAESGLEKTNQLAEKHNVAVHTKLTDLLEDELPIETFDTAIMVFGHFPAEHQQEVFKKIVDSVKSGGRIMMELYSIYQLPYASGGPRQLDFLYDPLDILKWCQPYKIIHFFTGEQVRNEGKLHTGLAHTIQFIIEKS